MSERDPEIVFLSASDRGWPVVPWKWSTPLGMMHFLADLDGIAQMCGGDPAKIRDAYGELASAGWEVERGGMIWKICRPETLELIDFA